MHEKHCHIGALRLRSGTVLPEVNLTYVSYGQLSPRADNAILVTHGYTASHHLLAHGAGIAEGSWAALIGPDRPLDPQRHFIICPNMLGSSYGSTGPASLKPNSDQLYGADFPAITISDIVASQAALLQRLGVPRLLAVIGPSMGGFQALQWAVDYPDRVAAVAAICATTYLPTSPAMDLQALHRRLCADPAWNHGRPQPGSMRQTLHSLRLQTLKAYGMEQILAQSIPDPVARQAQIAAMATAWANTFNPCSLLRLMQAAHSFDVRPQLSSVRADVLQVVASSDGLFPPSADDKQQLNLVASRHRPVYLEIQTSFGHSASGPAHALWSPALKHLLQHANFQD